MLIFLLTNIALMKMNISVIGQCSTGKTSFINSFAGAIVSPIKKTLRKHTFKFSPYGGDHAIDVNFKWIQNRTHGVTEWINEEYRNAFDFNDWDDYYQKTKIYNAIEAEITDYPGFKSRDDSFFRFAVNEICYYDYVFYVSDSEKIFEGEEHEFILSVKEHIDSIFKKGKQINLFVIINKHDDNIYNITKYVDAIKHLSLLGIQEENIFPYSSHHSLIYNMVMYGFKNDPTVTKITKMIGLHSISDPLKFISKYHNTELYQSIVPVNSEEAMRIANNAIKVSNLETFIKIVKLFGPVNYDGKKWSGKINRMPSKKTFDGLWSTLRFPNDVVIDDFMENVIDPFMKQVEKKSISDISDLLSKSNVSYLSFVENIYQFKQNKISQSDMNILANHLANRIIDDHHLIDILIDNIAAVKMYRIYLKSYIC